MASPSRGAVHARPCPWIMLLVLGSLGVNVDTEFVEPPPSFSLRSLAEGSTRLPCLFQVQDEDQVVQVTWNREKPDGTKEPIITAHRTEGHTEFGRFSGRVQFENSDPMRNAALIIRSTEVSDEGTFICHISTFPSGNFERQLFLSVWTTPISSLDPVEMVEGQSYRVAATCRSVARPPPCLSWDTDLPGQSQNRSSEGGAVSTYFSLHPLRSMNGKRLDCLVWHSSLEKPRRITNRLVVHFPPDATVRGYDGNWFVGLEGVSLRCDSGGNPKPQTFTWSRRGGALPEGVTIEGADLRFDRPITEADAGVYECSAQNSVGAAKTEVLITVAEVSQKEPSLNSLMAIMGGAAGALLVVMVIAIVAVSCYHKRKNKKLEKELSEKIEEFSTLSRHASFRRVNSVNSDPRIQMDDSVPLRLESPMRTSQSSLSGGPGKRDSLSTVSVGRGDRASLYSSSLRRDRARDRDAHTHDSGWQRSQSPAPLPELGYPRGWGGSPTPPEDLDADEPHSLQMSEAVSHYFHYSNGVLHPKPHPNAILLHPKGQII
ncbi:hypothetical protein AGOR_G00031970 [Albula goreensis]|uniref:Ig-like domain-containing protein n=1 Tax=Albula goreensis TaxID=1534307 RepID=A0A8T3DWA0_9TELE|nr:hypothetical protein AGOR_G00031970 [Albula goreensis]